MTPVQLEVLLHISYRRDVFVKDAKVMSEAHMEAHRYLYGAQMIDKSDEPTLCDSMWSLTERGEVYVEALRKLALPTQTWSMPK